MAADDLVYAEERGEAIPVGQFVQKVFVLEPNILIGTWGVGMHRKIKYETQPWISEFIEAHGDGARNRPREVAADLCTEMRNTFQVLEALSEDGIWKTHQPGHKVISFVVAGYTETFTRPYFFEVGTEVNRQGNGFVYNPPESKPPESFIAGEDVFLTRAMEGQEPQFSARNHIHARIVGMANAHDIPSGLKEVITSMVSLIKVEAYFNSKNVGRNVAVVALDRLARRSLRYTF